MAAGFAVFVLDPLRPKSGQPQIPRNPWNAGTLEWSHDIPEEAWGVRSIPHVTTRYPLWDRRRWSRMDAGRYYLPDAPRAARHFRDLGHRRRAGAVQRHLTDLDHPARGGLHRRRLHLPTFHIYWPAIPSARRRWVASCGGSDRHRPPARNRNLRRGPRPDPADPCRRSCLGRLVGDVDHHAGDAIAFASLIFGFFFYRRRISRLRPRPAPPWLVGLAAIAFAATWALTVGACRLNRGGRSALRAIARSSHRWLPRAAALIGSVLI
ncbi:hypothetical protein [Salipiger sp.]|uniref:hypothetical protein n=1 Tax=Salipiger sp. TaxID=2078585 RepID=UPI003A970E1C